MYRYIVKSALSKLKKNFPKGEKKLTRIDLKVKYTHRDTCGNTHFC